MIAIITSCIRPIENTNDPKSHFSVKERENQTIFTLEKLSALNFKKIIVVDNSVSYDFNELELRFKHIKFISIKQFQFENKGINELLMLLAEVDELPENTPIFKISGRYYPNEDFNINFNEAYDFKVKAYNFDTKRGSISTRAYFVKNKQIYKNFLLKTFIETFTYSHKIVGIRSFIYQLKRIFIKNLPTSISTSIEFAAARVLKNENYKVEFVNKIGVEGQIAGFKELSKIKE
ncbi:hypothetical protein [Pedobacter flavus]|uniref:Uncharacterized protein n=1 Tax=Pedobacter flavus TaxID=3113906 RepID=A0ABU7GY72_9SPHI|nr:hypothetical protein [Pedobacter sp. VNH31]MEE1883920.1 hypothetical protein [Pedobacter sp. VNH31]